MIVHHPCLNAYFSDGSDSSSPSLESFVDSTSISIWKDAEAKRANASRTKRSKIEAYDSDCTPPLGYHEFCNASNSSSSSLPLTDSRETNETKDAIEKAKLRERSKAFAAEMKLLKRFDEEISNGGPSKPEGASMSQSAPTSPATITINTKYLPQKQKEKKRKVVCNLRNYVLTGTQQAKAKKQNGGGNKGKPRLSKSSQQREEESWGEVLNYSLGESLLDLMDKLILGESETILPADREDLMQYFTEDKKRGDLIDSLF